MHEDSHLDQSIHDPRWKTEWSNYNLYEEWADRTRLMNKKQLHRAIDSLIECELDCDQRTVQKILDWNLPIPTTTYIQRCNLIYYAYRASVEYGKFPMGITDDKEIWRHCPPKFRKSYDTVPPKVLALIHEFYEKKAV